MIAQIVVGSKAIFDIKLRTPSGDPVSLSPYVSGILRFKNCSEEITEIALDVPGSSPDSGIITVEILNADTEDADDGWSSADVILEETGGELVIVPLKDAFEIITPAVIVPTP